MEAIPKGLVSRESLKAMSGIKSIRTSILPSNSSGNFSFSATGNNKIVLQVPSFPNSFVNNSRSFLRFTLTTSHGNGIILPGANVFRRMLIKNSRGQVLEDVDNYDTLCRIMANMKTEAEIKAGANSTADFRAQEYDKAYAYQAEYGVGKTVVHEIQSGLFGKTQEFLIPVSSMNASAGYAFQIELYLNDSAKVCMSKNATECTYALTDVVYETELVEVSDAIMSDINSELVSGGEIPLPYKSWRSHSTGLSGSGTKHTVNISESAINLEAIYSVIQKQSHNAVTGIDTAIKNRNDDNDPLTFRGGRYAVDETNTVIIAPSHVTKYSWRYGSTYYPSAPIDLDRDSTLALETALHVFDVKDTPFMGTCDDQTLLSFAPRFETSAFILAHNFKTTADNIDNGLNASSSGAPVQLSVEFAANPNADSDKEIVTFIQQSNTLFVKQGGSSSIIAG